MNAVVVGLDLGQAQDYTAWAVVERVDCDPEPAAYHVRHIDRTRAAIYPAVVEHSRELVTTLRRNEPRPDVDLVVDYTGVGRPVADLLAAANLDAGLRLMTITGGEAVLRGDRGEWRVPKRELAAVIQVLLQTGRLRIGADLPLARTLTEELINFRVKISLAGHDSYGAGAEWREDNHDDLVLALALACWWGERHPPLVLVAPVGIPRTDGLEFRLSRKDTFTMWDGRGSGGAPDPWAQ
jgi:hypothetical protein